jgi:DNA-binding response OmpR family regulator
VTPYSSEASAAHQGLSGYQVLIVEDDYFVAMDLCSTLRARGATVVGPAPNIGAGRDLARERTIDCVLLDVNVQGEHAFALAQELRSRGVRPIFTTGYDVEFIPPHLRDIVYLQKPVDTGSLVESIRREPPRSARA